jgi:DNA-binding protein HU-beta
VAHALVRTHSGHRLVDDSSSVAATCEVRGTFIGMTKNNLIDHVARITQGTKKDTEQLIDAVLASITEALAKGEKVDLRGFGIFQVSRKKERQGRNPRTGEAITIAARNAILFKPGKELSGRLNGTVAGGDQAGDTDNTVAQPQEGGSAKIHGDKIES